MEEKIPCIFYYYIHNRMYEKYKGREISIKEAKKFMFEWRILTPLRPLIIRELELLGLVKRIKKRSIKINKSNFNIDDLYKYSTPLGIF